MIDDPNPATSGGADRTAARVARADTHVPTPAAAGGRTRARRHRSDRPQTSAAHTHHGASALRDAAGPITFGVGLGGLVDGVVLHQLLQWHHLVSVPTPPNDLAALEANTLADGAFHAVALVVLAIGTWLVSTRRVTTGTLVLGSLVGWGAFNVVEGLLNHVVLDLHHVNETVDRSQWWMWDAGLLGLGALVAVGATLALLRRPR